jgi:hypothetical protein
MNSSALILRRLGAVAVILTVVATVGACGSKSLVENFTSNITASDFQASGPVTGTVSVTVSGQKVDGTYNGTIKIKGKDSASTMTMVIAGSTTTNDKVSLGDSDYSRTGGGSWTKSARSANGMDVPALVAGGVTDKGVETHNGQPLHHLELSKAPDAKAFFDDPNMASGNFTLVLWSKDDGSPAGMTISGSWTQDMNGAPAQATLAIDFSFDSLSGVDIQAPSV